MNRLVVMTFVLGLVAGACSADRAADEVGDFSDIAVAPPVIEFDPSGTAATLLVSTSQDVVCAVSYGVDEPFGSIATDQDMAGAGHSDHRPVMSGLQPGTEYHYRLQGVATDGRIYRSEVMTFTTPSVEP